MPVKVEEDMHQYLREIGQYPLLTPQQERDIAMACAQGDQDAIKKLVNSNLRLVVSVAREYAGQGAPLLDMIQEGSIGLLDAAKRFDYTRELRFSTYATKWIRQGVIRCLTQHNAMIRVPQYTWEKIRKLLQAQAALRTELGREPEVEELAQRCQITPQRVKKLLGLYPQICSLDTPVGDEDTLRLFLEDSHSPQPQETLVREELSRILETLLRDLTPRQQSVLRLHFGLEDGVCYSMEQIGSRLGISKERVRQIERQAMDRLQSLGTDLGLEDFLE